MLAGRLRFRGQNAFKDFPDLSPWAASHPHSVFHDRGCRARASCKLDPYHAPDPTEWLAIDEQERIVLVEAFHRSFRVDIPSFATHAVFHAMAWPPKQGLIRHDAVHAVSWVLAQHIHEIMTIQASDPKPIIQARYDAAFVLLTAADWRAQFQAAHCRW